MLVNDHRVIILHLVLILISMLRYRYVLSKKETPKIEAIVALYFSLIIVGVLIFFDLVGSYLLYSPFAIMLFFGAAVYLTPFFDKYDQIKRKQFLKLLFLTLIGFIFSVAIFLNIAGKIGSIGG